MAALEAGPCSVPRGQRHVRPHMDLLSPDLIKSYKASDPETPVIFRRGDIADVEPGVPE